MSDDVISLRMKYGRTGQVELDIPERQLMLHHASPPANCSTASAISQAFDQALDFPEVETTFVPGDQVVVVIERDTPSVELIFAELWKRLSTANVQPGDVKILQPATWRKVEGHDPRSLLPEEIQSKIALEKHDPTAEGTCSYLASTAGNERVYLARAVTDADVVVTIGPAMYDSVLGVRGTCSSLYPGLSDVETLQKVQGQGHEELGPEDTRPLRQIVDEIGWLIGVQLSISVIPGPGGEANEVIVGQTDSVLRQVRKSLRKKWYVRSSERAEMVIVSVQHDAGGQSWDQIAAAANIGRRLVERNGRIVILSELSEAPGAGLEILKSVREPKDAIKLIQKANPPDAQAAIRIAFATDWANVCLLSKLESQTVSDLFMIPIEHASEVARLIESEDITTIVENGQFAFVSSGI
ncbi:lactate racemase domain-containing protein [Planctomicrobium sp. SH668]|uniref:lactate racemase domain-containing protein n=1 Tax=Planctomicrobium sp. SH668 TaxID=3448126 RepID=UPI003F5C6063